MNEWLDWNGGSCPVADGTLVDIKFRDGSTENAINATRWSWKHLPGDPGSDIISYRLVEPKQPKQPKEPLKGDDNLLKVSRIHPSEWDSRKVGDLVQFAGNALQGLCANHNVFGYSDKQGWYLVNCSEKQLADYCWHIAKVMIEQRPK